MLFDETHFFEDLIFRQARIFFVLYYFMRGIENYYGSD